MVSKSAEDIASLADVARNAEKGDDLVVAMAACKKLMNNYPDQSVGYLLGARMSRLLSQPDDEERFLLVGIEVATDRISLFIELAWVAHRRGDWSNALERWRAVDVQFPNHSAGSVGIGRVLYELRRLDEADIHLEKAMLKFPTDENLRLTFAQVASAREDWTDALRRWDRAAMLRPLDASGLRARGVALWHSRFEAASDATPSVESAESGRIVLIERVSDPSANQLLMEFESLGENCELGLVQRRYEAEPLGLLRWTYIGPDMLVKLLLSRFDGLADDNNLELKRTSWGEYFINDLKYGISFHTFSSRQIDNGLEFLSKQAARLRWLREKMLTDLSKEEKIFVYKVHHSTSTEKASEVFSALQKYGNNALLWITVAQDSRLAGTVTEKAPGLFFGYISRPNPDNQGNWDIPYEEWLCLCKEARRIADRNSSTC